MHNQPREQQPYEDCQAKLIQEFGWTSQGMDWGWGQATTHRGFSISNECRPVTFLLLGLLFLLDDFY